MPSEKQPPPSMPNRGVSVPPKHMYTSDGKKKPSAPASAEKGAKPAPAPPARKPPVNTVPQRGANDAKPAPAPPARAAKPAPAPPPPRPASPPARPAAAQDKGIHPARQAHGVPLKKPAAQVPAVNTERDDEMESEWKGIVLRKRRPMFNGCLRGMLYFAVVSILSVILAVNVWSWANDALGLTKEQGSVTIVIAEDYDYKSLSKQLRELGVIEHAWLFEMYCNMSGADEHIDPGERVLITNHDYRALVRDMRYIEEKVQIKITFPEGITLNGIVDLLVENGISSKEALLESIANDDFGFSFLEGLPATENRLEGYLYPDTYFFYSDEGPRSIFRKFLVAYNQNLPNSMRRRIEEMPYSMHEILTIASLIQSEAAGVGEMKSIAAVIYNRLNNADFPNLQVDAALIYVMDGRREITAADKEMDSPYNLYRHVGLPPGPICSPSINAIRAALYPSHENYLYYAMTDAGVHQFSKTYNEHLKVIRDNPIAHPG